MASPGGAVLPPHAGSPDVREGEREYASHAAGSGGRSHRAGARARRRRRREARSQKPYTEMTWQEKKELEKREAERAEERNEAGLSDIPLTRDGRIPKGTQFADFRPPAPRNTSQFLMKEDAGANASTSRNVFEGVLAESPSASDLLALQSSYGTMTELVRSSEDRARALREETPQQSPSARDFGRSDRAETIVLSHNDSLAEQLAIQGASSSTGALQEPVASAGVLQQRTSATGAPADLQTQVEQLRKENAALRKALLDAGLPVPDLNRGD